MAPDRDHSSLLADARRAGPIPGPLGAPLARIYGSVIARRNRDFDRGRGVITLDRPVISIGNLSVGGTGKTPLVAWTVRELLGAGRRPCIAMRGYRARGGKSDEADEYAASLPGVPVVARPDRAEGLIELFATEAGEQIDTIVLDDGFQHRRLARRMDVVLLDASRPPFDDHLLPAGWLREPVSSLQRATHIVLTHAQAVPPAALGELSRAVERESGRAPAAVTRHDWAGLQVTAPGAPPEQHPVSWLQRRRVLAVCAIGNPGPFLARAAASSGTLAGTLSLRDHDPYSPRTVDRLRRDADRARADVILTTAKDWTKLAAAGIPLPVAVPELRIAFDSGESELQSAVLAAAATNPDDPGD